MRKALTAAAVERMKPPAKGQIEVFDRGYPGLLLRVSYGGGKAFAMFYRHGGKLRRLTLGWHPAMTLAEAREAWRDARRLVAIGQDPGRTAGQDKRHRRQCRRGVDQARQARRQAHDRLPDRGRAKARRAAAVGRPRYRLDSKREIHELLDGIVDRAPGTARAVHSHLRSLFRWATGREIHQRQSDGRRRAAHHGQSPRSRVVRRRARQGVARRRRRRLRRRWSSS